MSPYAFSDYKKYLNETIKKKGGRGIKANLADAAGCQRSFLSQVLNGSVHLTPEHALGIAKYLRLNSQETEYFYLLVGQARSGSSTLTKYYAEKLSGLKSQGENLSKRLEHASFDVHEIAEYYSIWVFAAVHIGCTISSLRTPLALAKKFGLEVAEVDQVLGKLRGWGLVEEKKNEWFATKKLMHIPKDHFMIMTNHKNWRAKILELAEGTPDRGINYSAVYSMSRDDFERLKEMVIEFLNESRQLVEPSREEELVGFCLDCVRV